MKPQSLDADGTGGFRPRGGGRTEIGLKGTVTNT